MKTLIVSLCVWLLSRWAPEKLRPVKKVIAPDAFSCKQTGVVTHCAGCSRSIAGAECSYWSGRDAAGLGTGQGICQNCWMSAHGFPS